MKQDLSLNDFPTQEKIILNRDTAWAKISGIIENMLRNEVFSTSSQDKIKKIKNSINSKELTNKLAKLNLNIKTPGNKKIPRIVEGYAVGDCCQELCLILFDGRLEAFIEEYGEVKKYQKEFIGYCKNITKTEIYIEEYGKNAEYIENLTSDDDTNANEMEFIDHSEKIKQEENVEYIYDDKYKKDINEIDCTEYIMQYIMDSISRDEELKKAFILYYYVFIDTIARNKDLSPTDMHKMFIKTVNNNGKMEKQNIIFEDIKKNTAETKDRKERYTKNLNSEEKAKKIREHLDPLGFWDFFETHFEKEITENDYYSIYNSLALGEKQVIKQNIKIVKEKKTRTQMRRFKKIKERMLNCIIDEIKKDDILSNFDTRCFKNKFGNDKNDTEIKNEIIKELIEKLKNAIPKKEIRNNRDNNLKIKSEVLENLSKNSPCNYKLYNKENLALLAQDTLRDENTKERLKKHLETCSKCRDSYLVIKKGIKYRLKRNSQISYKLAHPYQKPEVLSEEEYLNNESIKYYKKEFRKNPCEINFHYLVLSYIKNGKTEDAYRILKEGLVIYKENVFIQRTQIYIENNSID